MKASRVDKVAVVWIGAAQVLWACCLAVLWAWALVPTGTSLVASWVGLACAAAVGVLLPGRLARVGLWALRKLSPHGALAATMQAVTGPGTRATEVRAINRLLGLSAVLAGVLAAVSTALVAVGAAWSQVLLGRFLWSDAGWFVVSAALQAVSLLPMAVGMSATFVAGSLLLGGGRNAYGRIVRDWVLAVGVGLVLFAVAWWAGMNIVGTTAVAGVALLAGGVALLIRREVSLRPPRITETARPPRWRQKLGVAIPWAAVSAVALAQGRMLTDIVGAGLAGRLGWLGGSALLMGIMLARADARSSRPGRAQQLAGVLGLVSGLLSQAALTWMSVARPGPAGVLLFLAAGTQPAVVALAAMLISAGRRSFASTGGRDRMYVSWACWGLAGGAAATLGVLASGHTLLAVVLVAVGVLADGAYRGVWVARRRADVWRWPVLAILVVGSALGGGLWARMQVLQQTGPLHAGVWLTRQEGLGGRRGAWTGQRKWRSGEVDRALTQLRQRARGWWQVSADDPRDWLAEAPSQTTRWAWTDRTAGGELPAEDGALTVPASYPLSAMMHAGVSDHVFLAPLPADHPEAWRVYNRRVLTQSADGGGGLSVLRTQAAPDRLGAVLAVWRTFLEAVDSGWAVVAFSADGSVDVLLAGPADAMGKPDLPAKAFVVRLRAVADRWPGIGPVRMSAPSASMQPGSVSPAQLHEMLQQAEAVPQSTP